MGVAYFIQYRIWRNKIMTYIRLDNRNAHILYRR